MFLFIIMMLWITICESETLIVVTDERMENQSYVAEDPQYPP